MANARSKQNAKLAYDRHPPKVLVGKKVQYVGLCGAVNTCPQCGRVQRRGILSSFNELLFCGEPCVLAAKAGKNQ